MPIPLNEALDKIHQKKADGKPAEFHIVFFTQNGKRVELPNAVRCALPPAQRGNRELVGIRPNIKGRHDYSVHQKLITQFNKITVAY
jgi:hypothetical protein